MEKKLLPLYFFSTRRAKHVLSFILVILIVLILNVQIKKANACISCNYTVAALASSLWYESANSFDDRSDSEFLRLETFVFNNIWMESILPVLMLSAEQFTAAAMQQVFIIGTFLDAKNQLETQHLLQIMQARAHREYHPSEGMCELGTAMKALASSDMRSEFTSFILSQRSQDRQMGATQSVGAYGNDLDKVFRITQFKDKFCNEKDRRTSLGGRSGSTSTALSTLCPGMDHTTMTPEKMVQMNKDVDFFNTVDSPLTLSIDFTNNVIVDTSTTPPVLNEDEENVFAMSVNLFGNESFARPPPKTLEYIPGQQITTMQQAFMDMRSLIAKRSVAENSFNAIVGSKSEGVRATDFEGIAVTAGSGGQQLPMRSRSFIQNIVQNLGVSATDSLKLFGENPSYNAQMEVLTKKIFQSPDFYTNLYDKPLNVERKAVAMQAIKMMQKFDMLKSSLRGEASLSILLELAVSDLQQEIEAQINTIDVSETR